MLIFVDRFPKLLGQIGGRALLRLKRNGLHCSKGAVAIEFALITPVLAFMAIGAYDVSTVIKQKLAVQNAARIGAQYGMVRRPVQGDMQYVVNAVRQTLPQKWNDSGLPTSAQVNATLQCECSQTGQVSCSLKCTAGQRKITYLQVEVSKSYKTFLPYPGLATNFEISDKSIVRLQ